jgi:hypothetical protein
MIVRERRGVTRRGVAVGAGVLTFLTLVATVLINEVHKGWPWVVSASVIVVVTSGVAMLVASRDEASSPGAEPPPFADAGPPGSIHDVGIRADHGSISGWNVVVGQQPPPSPRQPGRPRD